MRRASGPRRPTPFRGPPAYRSPQFIHRHSLRQSRCREIVYVCARHPNGLTESQHRKLLARNAEAKGWGWQRMGRNPSVFVRGRISHADHKTIMLHEWHLLMNTENQSTAMRSLAFLD